MDEQIKKRQYRITLAPHQRDTTRQWDLVAAAVEQANIEFHKLEGAEAKKMRGRSEVAFKQVEKSALEGAEKEAEHAEGITRLEMLRSLAASHNVLGNKLSSIVKRMKTNARCRDNKERFEENVRLNSQTVGGYFQHVEKTTKKKEIIGEKKRQIKANWYRRRPGKVKNEEEREALNIKYDEQLLSLQQGAQEIHEMGRQMEECDTTNIIHSAKIARLAEAHVRRAKSYMDGK